ncbi:MAG: hypothetical protein QUT30_06315 [Acidobacteriota bacterium]|nr:hypothetical protein [Acidobacteriota bacterium]
MGIANYTNLSELMNERLEKGQILSISDLVKLSQGRKLILASEGEMADQADLENGFIALVDKLYQANAIKPLPANETEENVLQLFISGKLAEEGYDSKEADQFLEIKWAAAIDPLPVITNITTFR